MNQNDPLHQTRLVTIPAVADALSVSKRHVFRMIDRGELPTIRVGLNSTRIPVDAVEQFVKSRFDRKGV